MRLAGFEPATNGLEGRPGDLRGAKTHESEQGTLGKG